MGWAVWRTLTSVRFAVLQISVLAVAGVIGTVLNQIPAFALHDAQAYADQVSQLHATYDRLSILGVNIGPQFVDVAERFGFFRVFSSPWFVFLLTLLVVSIVVCTLDRTPAMWRTAHNVRIVQAAPFFDLRLNERARFTNVDDAAADELAKVLRGRHFKVRQETVEVSADTLDEPIRHLYGDRNQYLKLATLFTHLGLILFLAGGAVTTAFGYETVVFLGEGQTAPVQAVGTPDNLLVKNIHFDAPRRPDGNFADFTTDLAVYRNGQEVARKIIRVNDPLQVGDYVFHQNTFGPAEDIAIRDPNGALVWDGPVLLDGALGDLPQGFITIPGSDLGLLAGPGQDRAGHTAAGGDRSRAHLDAGGEQHRLSPRPWPGRYQRAGHHRRLHHDVESGRVIHRHGHQARPRAGSHLDRVPEPDHRPGPDVLLPATPSLGAPPWRPPGDGLHRRPLRGKRPGIRDSSGRPLSPTRPTPAQPEITRRFAVSNSSSVSRPSAWSSPRR